MSAGTIESPILDGDHDDYIREGLERMDRYLNGAEHAGGSALRSFDVHEVPVWESRNFSPGDLVRSSGAVEQVAGPFTSYNEVPPPTNLIG